jgi:hypothetical protein
MCKDPYFNAQVCRLLVVINVILCVTNVILYFSSGGVDYTLLHAVFNLLVAAWMLQAFKHFKKQALVKNEN